MIRLRQPSTGLPAATGVVSVDNAYDLLTVSGDLRTVRSINLSGLGVMSVTFESPDLSRTEVIDLHGTILLESDIIALCDILLGGSSLALTVLDVRDSDVGTIDGLTVGGTGEYMHDPRGGYTFLALEGSGAVAWTLSGTSWGLRWNDAADQWEICYLGEPAYIGGDDMTNPAGEYAPVDEENDDPVTVAGDGWDGDWTGTGYWKLGELVRRGVGVYYGAST